MTKKIKDLTYEERISICKQHNGCSNCPLSVIDFNGEGYCINTVMNREVEVDD